MIVTLPWPPRELSINSRVHFRVVRHYSKIVRESSYWLTRKAMIDGQHQTVPDGEILVKITFHPPTRRRFDLDGLLTRSKAAIDGFADALAVDDYRFAFLIKRAEPIKGGAVILEI